VSAPHAAEVARRIDALEKDLVFEGGPRISTVRNYNFAILPYPPEAEFTLRRHVHEVCDRLRGAGWTVGIVSLQALLMQRVRGLDPAVQSSIVRKEKMTAGMADRGRGLRQLKEQLVRELEGPTGIAADVIAAIQRTLDEGDAPTDRTVIFLSRAGALYPFMRTSALLKSLDKNTRNAPVILLYPGTVDGENGLRFMGILPPDRDYRPRIYR
jgi:hypothetical protein